MNVLITSASRKVWLVQAFRRAVAQEGGGLVVAAEASPYAPALYAADRACRVPWGLSEPFFNAVLDIARRHEIGLIIPTRDEELPAFAQKRTMFEAVGVRVMTADQSVIRVCQDKGAFVDYCLAHGFSVPRLLEPPFQAVRYPVFVRSRITKGSRDAFRVSSVEELQFLLQWLRDPIVQECIDADEYTVDVFADLGGRVVSAVPRLRMGVFGGESFVGKTVRHPGVIHETIRLVESLGLVGFATVQCFWHEETVKFIEVNPRIGGGANLSIAAGADTPRLALQAAAGKPIVPAIGQFKAGLVMLRHTEDRFVDEDDLDAVFGR